MTDSDGVFTADGRLFHDDGTATGKLLGSKLAVLVLGTSRNADVFVIKLPAAEQSLTTNTGI